ncbi:MAG: DUF1700 domain-containing protein [Clostridia bacterium]|nr:DUF1700 domain-containing protein [Clostridia bacterium]
MNKQDFLTQLRKELSCLPQEDVEERLTFYSEMIDDRVEEGLSESEAISQLGSVDELARQILADTPLTKIAKEKVKPNRALKAWEIILLILGAPIWLSLLIAVVAIIFAVYVVIWSVIVSLWSIEASFVACSIGGFVSAVIFVLQGNGLTALAMVGAGLCCVGLSIFMLLVCKACTKAMILLTKKIALWIKALIVGKEAVR